MATRTIFKILVPIICLQSLFVSAQVDTVKEKLKFDFGFTRSNNINVWPLYKQVISPTYKEIDVLFPFFVKKKDEINRSNYLHLVPIVFNSKTPAYKDFRLFSLYYPSLFHYRKDSNDVKSYRFLEILPRFSLMDIRKSSRGIYLDQNLLFFIWFKKDLQLQQSHFVVFPLSWYYKNGADKSYTLFPLFTKRNYGENNMMALTPLFWHFKNNKKVSNTLFPLWFQRKSLDPEIKYSSNVIFPLWWSSKDFLGSKKVLFPFYWDYDVLKYHSTTIFPLFSYGSSTDNKESHTVITPLYWQSKNKKQRNTLLFPFWWRNENYTFKDTTIASIIFPFSWNIKSKYSHTYTFFPLFSYGHYPGNSYFAITPIYWHTESSLRSGNTIFPIFWQRRSKDPERVGSSTILFPLWWSHSLSSNTHKILFPIYWDFKSKNYHNITAIPLFSRGWSSDGKRKYFAITPFYWNRTHEAGHSRTLFPIFWNNTRYSRNDTLKTNILFPVLWDFSSKKYHNTLLLPIYANFRGPNYHSTSVMPLFSSGSSTDGTRSHYAVSPLFWHFKTSNTRSSLLLPLFYHRKAFHRNDTLKTTMAGILWWSIIKGKNNYTHLLFPIFWDIKNPSLSSVCLFPVFWKTKTPNSSMISLFPLFYHSRNSIQDPRSVLRITPLFHYTFRDNIKNTVLFPIFWDKRSLDLQHPFRETIVFPLYWSITHGENRTRTLFPLIWSRKNSAYTSFTFFPLFSSGRSADGNEHHIVVTPLYWYSHQKDNTFSTFFPIWWHKQTTINGIEKNTSFLFPLWFSQKSGEEKTKVLFPLYWYIKENGYSSTTILPLLSSKRSNDGTFSRMMITPLIWRQKDNDKVRFTAFPLFWYKKSEQLKYHTLMPFYFYSSSPSTRNFQFLLLVYNYRRNQDQSIYNGILWKTVYWNKYKDGGHEFRLLYLLFANVNKKDLIEKSYFPIYYYSKVKNRDITKAWFFYFYSRSTNYISEIKDYYIEERIFWFVRIRSNYNQLEKEGKARYIKKRRHPNNEMPSGNN